MNFIFEWASQHGYFGLFSLLMVGIFGVPVPDETLLTFSGYLVSRGDLNLLLTIAAASSGSMVGITFSYMLGRFGGFFLVQKYGRLIHVTENEIERIHNWFGRIGKWSLTVGYFLPGIRHFTAITAGTSRMKLPTFMLFAYSGALIWSITFILIGRAIGDRWESFAEHLHHHLVLLALAVVVLIAALYFVQRWLRRRILGHRKS